MIMEIRFVVQWF